jgi:hypothetical protein
VSDYESFLAKKRLISDPVGIPDPPALHPSLFPFQRDVTRWALRRGRAALFEECGLGKSRQALEWARVVCEHTGGNVLVMTPLAVAQQFVREGAEIGVPVTHCREASDVRHGVNVTNYERFDRFDPASFAGVVADESSILKSKDGKTRNALIEAWSRTRFRLACTATPAPNDHMELGNHAEFLGVMTQSEMLSMFFVHDGGETQKWRLKGHAEREFWRWVCSWAVCLTKPSDLGYENAGYDLPPLNVTEHIIQSDAGMAHAAGMLFAYEARTLDELRAARRASMPQRVARAAELANGDDEQWICWCDLNDESKALAKSIPGALEVTGSDKDEKKERAVLDFIDGKIRVLVSKPSIFGWGVNLQNCHNAAFVGLSHSFEQWYQATRRIWRFGQSRPVNSHIITSSAEGAVLKSLERKRLDFERMVGGMAEHMADISKAEIGAARRDQVDYRPGVKMRLPDWLSKEAS